MNRPPNIVYILLCLIFSSAPISLTAQELEHAPDTSFEGLSLLQKAQAMENFAAQLAQSKPLLASQYYDSVAQIYQETGDQRAYVEAMAQSTIQLQDAGLNFRTLKAFEQIETQLDLLDTTHVRRDLLNRVARAYGRLGEPQKSIMLLMEALELSQEAKDTLSFINNLERMASRYYSRDLEKAIALRDSALQISLTYSKKDPNTIATLYNNRGSMFLMAGRIDEAKLDLEQSLVYARQSGMVEDFLYAYFTLAEISLAQDNLSAAAEYFRKGASYKGQTESALQELLAVEAHSHYLLLVGKPDSSEYWLEYCFATYDSLQEIVPVFDVLDLRSRLLAKTGDFEAAYEASELKAEINDQILSANQAQTISELQTINETDRMERDNALLRANNESIRQEKEFNSRMFITIGIGVLLTSLVLIVFLIRTRRLHKSIQEQNLRLADQNEQLTQLTQDNELLMGIVAHDLKAPLVKLQGLLDMIVAQNQMGPESEPLVNMARRVISGGQDLVKDILILSEAGRGSYPELEWHSLDEVVQGLTKDFSGIAGRKDIELVVASPEQAVEAKIHPPYLLRVLDNLLSNAIKFSPRGRKIYLSWGQRADGKRTWCEVRDEGPGIPEAEKGQLFQRFAKLSNRPTAGESSSGLGLYIVKTLLDATSCSISVETAVGKGTAFRIHFPDSTK